MCTKCIKTYTERYTKLNYLKAQKLRSLAFYTRTAVASIYQDEGGAAHFQQGKFLGSATLFKENLPTAFFVALATSQKVTLDFLWLEIS